MLDSDIRIVRLESFLKSDRLRVPLKFGSVIITELTSLIVKATVENKKGDVAEGWGAMPLAEKWAFPNPSIPHAKKSQAMKEIGERTCRLMEKIWAAKYGHPVDIMLGSKEKIFQLAKEIDRKVGLKAPTPILGILVSTSPIDAALHDAFGRVNGICSYFGYSREYMAHDLSVYLGDEFCGEYVGDYLKSDYGKTLPVFHLVGALDKLTQDDVDANDPKDGLPVSLEEWIKRDGVFCFKVKLSGVDINWDVARTKAVAELAYNVLRPNRPDGFYLSVDSNEMNSNPDMTLEYLVKLKKCSALAFKHLLYVEQPTERDMRCHMYSMDKVAAVKPVLADEGVTDLDSFNLALDLGWTGVALKTCKWHSSSLLYIAKMEKLGVPYSVQDLTCPGLALIHSASLSARINPIKGFEYNARQYLPFAQKEVQEKHRSLFTVKDGLIRTDSLEPIGLGFSTNEIEHIV